MDWAILFINVLMISNSSYFVFSVINHFIIKSIHALLTKDERMDITHTFEKCVTKESSTSYLNE